jgi:hypothetical protein
MPKISLAQQMTDWDRLLANARPHAEEYSYLGPILDELEKRRLRMEELDQQRQVLRAECQTKTHEIDRLKAEGKDLAMQVNDVMRSKYGIGSPYLRAFNLKPRGKYKKRRKKRAEDGAATGAGDAPVAT